MAVQIQAALNQLKTTLRGDVIRGADPGYEAARKVYNAMINRRPLAVARCADVADVITVVNFAREHGLPLAVRGGGHSGGGLGTCDGGLVLDLARMRNVQIDPDARTAIVGGGCTLGDIDHATHPFGLAVASGINSTTGIGGLTLGGGMGYLTRKFGLTIDSLLAVNLVLADGRYVTASATQHADLFWALRGGGGNFGVVTAFHFRLHPVHTVIAGATIWPLALGADALRFYADYLSAAPEELGGIFSFFTVPPWTSYPEHLHLRKVCGVTWCYVGAPEQADKVFAPIRAFGPPLWDGVQALPYPVLQQATDRLYPSALQWYWRGDFLNELTDEAVDDFVERGNSLPTAHSRLQLFALGGAVARVGRQETVFNFREAKWSAVIIGVDPNPTRAQAIREWTLETWQRLHPHTAGGAYVNFMMEEGHERIKATYGDNYPRLAQIKAQYDPENLFRINHNVQPAHEFLSL